MPTNLPPEAQEAERRYREAQTPAEKIACLEEYLSAIPKHKGTDHLRAGLRRQLSQLKGEVEAGGRRGGHQNLFTIEREGAGQVAVLGLTNSGKSALVAALTRAEPEVSEAPYTTWVPLPGMMSIENIQVQLIDTPPLDRDFVEPGLFDLVRRADLILLVVDLRADPLEQMETALELLRERRIVPHPPGRPPAPLPSATLKPVIVLANKCDDGMMDEVFELLCALFEGDCPLEAVSAQAGRGFNRLKQRVYEALEIMRVYAKPPGKEPDVQAPFVLKRGATVADLARKVHRDFYENLKSARVWGASALFPGQQVQKDHVLQEGDVVELRV